MTATFAPAEYVNQLRHLIDENEDSAYNTLVIHQDEGAARRCVEVLESTHNHPDRTVGGGSVEICYIDGISIRLSANNNIHIKLPGAGRRFAYDYKVGHGPSFRASNGDLIYFDRKFPHHLSRAVVDKLADLLARQNAVIEHEIEDDLCNPPADLVEDDTVEETPSTIDLLR